MPAEMLEAIVVDHMKNMLTGEEVKAQVEQVQESLRQAINEKEYALKEAEASLHEIQRRKAMLEEDYWNRRISADSYDRLSKRADEGLRAVSERLSGTRQALAEAQSTTVDMEAMSAIASRLDVWAELSIEEMKQVLRDVIHQVRIYQKKRQQRTSKRNTNPLTVEITPTTATFVRANA